MALPAPTALGWPFVIRDAAARLLTTPGASRVLGGMSGWLGRGVVLVYHRVVPGPVAQPVVVPTVTESTLADHVTAIRAVGDIVPADLLLRDPRRGTRPRFAITFDDDAYSHVDHALPLLERLDVPATFFLAGRALHGLPGYWWDALEHDLAARGVDAVASRLGLEPAPVEQLAFAVERDRALQEALVRRAPAAALSADHIRRLAGTMSIGFHTLHHPVLTGLAGPDVERALVDGRSAIEDVIGRPIDLFAYPHGKADRHVAAVAAAAGYRGAFTGRPGRIAPRTDPFLVSRVEGSPMDADALVARLLVRLVEPLRRRRDG